MGLNYTDLLYIKLDKKEKNVVINYNLIFCSRKWEEIIKKREAENRTYIIVEEKYLIMANCRRK